MEQRIDKWLWFVRLFKTRSQATDACRGGLVKLNGEEVKPAKDIKPGDKISVRKGPLLVQVEVLAFPKSRIAASLLPTYLINHTPQEEIDRVRMIRDTAFVTRDKGAGRPTKKERRNLDSWGLWE